MVAVFMCVSVNRPTPPPVEPCYSNPCRNGGECICNPDYTYYCICRNRYTGTNCEIGTFCLKQKKDYEK